MTVKFTFAYLRVSRPFLASLFGLMIFQAVAGQTAPSEPEASPMVIVKLPAH